MIRGYFTPHAQFAQQIDHNYLLVLWDVHWGCVYVECDPPAIWSFPYKVGPELQTSSPIGLKITCATHNCMFSNFPRKDFKPKIK